MRFVIQRVKEASVQAEQEVIGEIKKGYTIFRKKKDRLKAK